MLAVTTALKAGDWVLAVVVLLAAIVLERLVPTVAWVAYLTLFAVMLFGVALTVHW